MSLTSLSKDELNKFMAAKCPDLKELSGEVKPVPVKRKIVIGILSYDGKMHCKNTMSLTQSLMAIAAEGWAFSYVLREGDSMVARGRNILISKFMEEPELKDATDLVLIDTDLEFSGADVVKLCKHPVDVVGGAYPFKDMAGNFPLRWPPEGLYEDNGLWTVNAVTPGFFRVTRKALEKMASEMPHLEFQDRATKGHKAWMFFDNVQRPNGVWDEGYIFCERWRQCGGTVYLDPDLNITHIGQYAFNHGTVRQWLDKRAETFTHLESEYPNVPPLKLMGKVMGEKIDLEEEQRKHGTDNQHRDTIPAGALEGDDRADAAEPDAGRHDTDGVGRSGRQRNAAEPEGVPEGRAVAHLNQAAGRQSRRKVRSGLNGSAGERVLGGG